MSYQKAATTAELGDEPLRVQLGETLQLSRPHACIAGRSLAAEAAPLTLACLYDASTDHRGVLGRTRPGQ